MKPRRLPISCTANQRGGSNPTVNAGSFPVCLQKAFQGRVAEWFSDSCCCPGSGCCSLLMLGVVVSLLDLISAWLSPGYLSVLASLTSADFPLEYQSISCLPASFCFSPYSSVHTYFNKRNPGPYTLFPADRCNICLKA